MAHGLREPILSMCFQRCGDPQDSGPINNTLNIARLERSPSLRAMLAREMGKMTMSSRPNLIVPVPARAEWLVQDISMAYAVPSLRLRRDPNTNAYAFGPHGRDMCAGDARIVIVGDVLEEPTDMLELADLFGQDRVTAIAAVWDRRPAGERSLGDIATSSLIREYIPPRLSDTSRFWRFVHEPA